MVSMNENSRSPLRVRSNLPAVFIQPRSFFLLLDEEASMVTFTFGVSEVIDARNASSSFRLAIVLNYTIDVESGPTFHHLGVIEKNAIT